MTSPKHRENRGYFGRVVPRPGSSLAFAKIGTHSQGRPLAARVLLNLCRVRTLCGTLSEESIL